MNEHLETLKAAFWNCQQWSVEDGIFVGDCEGWRIWLGRDKDGTCAGGAVHLERNVEIGLTPKVVDAWLKIAQTRLKH